MTKSVPYGAGREALIAATVDVVADKGMRGLTFRAVATRAGVNNSLVAHHFGTRENLLTATLEWVIDQAIEVTRLLDAASDVAFADALIASVAEQPQLHIFQYEMLLESRHNSRYRPAISRLYARYQEAAEQSLRTFGIEADLPAVARHVAATLDGIILQYIAGVPEAELRAAVHSLWLSLAEPPQEQLLRGQRGGQG